MRGLEKCVGRMWGNTAMNSEFSYIGSQNGHGASRASMSCRSVTSRLSPVACRVFHLPLIWTCTFAFHPRNVLGFSMSFLFSSKHRTLSILILHLISSSLMHDDVAPILSSMVASCFRESSVAPEKQIDYTRLWSGHTFVALLLGASVYKFVLWM